IQSRSIPPAFAEETVRSIAIRNDGSNVVGGKFNSVSGFPVGSIARVHGDTPGAPLLLVQPASQTLAAGRKARLFVTGTYAPETEHQWTFNGVSLDGATNPVLELPNIK